MSSTVELLDLVTDVGQLLIRSTRLGELLQALCERLAEHPGYCAAWVGFTEKDASVRVSHFSDHCDPPYLKGAFIVSTDPGDPHSRGPAGRSIIEDRPILIHEPATDPDFLPWRDRARESGITAVAAFPLHSREGDPPNGCLLVYSIAPGGISDEEFSLLGKLAESVEWAVHMLQERDRRKAAQHALQISEERLQHVIAGADLGFWDWQYQTGHHEVSDRWLEILGLERSDLRNDVTDWSERVHPDDFPQVEKVVQQAIEHRRPYRAEFRMRHKRGHWVWIEGSGYVAEWDSEGNPVRLCGTHQEIDQRKLAQALLLENEKRFRELLENLPNIAVQGYDRHHRVIFWNSASEKLFGYSTLEAMGRRLEELIIPPAEREEVSRRIDRWIEGGQSIAPGELRLLRKDGSTVHVFSSRALLRRDDGEPELFCIDMDLTPQREAMAELQHLATHDALTHLPNRNLLQRHLTERLQEAARQGAGVALLFIDLDNFKFINDSYGHDYGDRLLEAVTERFNSTLRQYDFLARFGGDEFVLVMSGVRTIEEVAVVAEKLCELSRRPFHIGNLELHISASIGVSLFPDNGANPSVLLKHADAAMYRAKETGRNHYFFFNQDLNRKIQWQMMLASGMRQALQNEETFMVYQPQIDLHTGEVRSVEAMVRWRHPAHGVILPGEFIPVAERSDLINQLSEWVLEQVCREKAFCKRSGVRGFPVYINLSGRDFRDAAFLDRYFVTLERYGLTPADVGIELTENVLIEGGEETERLLERLRLAGGSIALDDFGTGYSSLSYLKRFPVDTLKIDRSFIRDAPEDRDDANIVRAIVAMAHTLGIQVVAEGVESAAHHRLAVEAGCDLGQGFLFQAPVPLAEMIENCRSTPCPGTGMTESDDPSP